MCLIISSRHHLFENQRFTPYIAETAIACIKVLNSNRESPHKYKYYRLGRMYKESRMSKATRHNLINTGLHSFVSMNDAKQSYHGKRYCAYRALIPKGALYYIGICGELVSSALIVKERIK